MIYCNKCILPNTRPNIYILANGICSACDSNLHKEKVNWKNKKNEFLEIVKKIKSKNLLYDCLSL